MSDAAQHRFTNPRPWMWWHNSISNAVPAEKKNSLLGNRHLSEYPAAPGYHTVTGNLDEISYACAYCQVALFFNKRRFVPDDFCQKCYGEYAPLRDDTGHYPPWLQFLITKERSRRIRLLRYRKRGIDYLPISYEEYLSNPDILHDEQMHNQ